MISPVPKLSISLPRSGAAAQTTAAAVAVAVATPTPVPVGEPVRPAGISIAAAATTTPGNPRSDDVPGFLPSMPALDGKSLVDAASAGNTFVRQGSTTQGNRVRLLTDEGEVLPQLLSSIAGAKQQIDLDMFSLEASGAGRTVIDALKAKAGEGVAVNVQVDQVGSMVGPMMHGSDMVKEMTGAGINVIVNKRLQLRGGMQPVDHRKLLVVDGDVAFTGGMNLSRKFGKWHDVMAKVEGPAAARMGAEFVARWAAEGGKVTDQTRSLLEAGTDHSPIAGAADATAGVATLVNRPGVDHHASEFLLQALDVAKDRAYVLTPTLSNPDVIDKLIAAAKRGVDARVAVSGPEGWIGTRALGLIGSAFYKDLLNGGVKVYEQPGMSHAKVMLVDNVATVGSMNMTRRAMLWDHELNIASDDPTFRAQIENLFQTDFGRSHQVTQADAHKGAANVARTIKDVTGLKW